MKYTKQKKDKITYPIWVRGFKYKDQIVKHHYLRDDFVFDSQK